MAASVTTDSATEMPLTNDSRIHVHPSLALAHTASLGFHVVARAPIEAGAALVEVPLAACLDLGAADDGGDGEDVAELRAAGAPAVLIAAIRLLRHMHAPESALGPHAELLKRIPADGNVVSWQARHVELLRGTTLMRAAAAFPIAQKFRDIVPAWLAARRAAGTAMAWPDLVLDETAVLHAVRLVMSRGFHAPDAANAAAVEPAAAAARPSAAALSTPGGAATTGDGPYLVPVCDLFNYHPLHTATQLSAITTAAPDSGGASGGAGGGGSGSGAALLGFRYEAQRPIAAGEQVYISYGALSDAELLHTYGFVIEDAEAPPFSSGLRGYDPDKLLLASPAFPNPHNTVRLALSDVVTAVASLFAAQGRDGSATTKRAHALLKRGAGMAAGPYTLQVQAPSAAEAAAILSGGKAAALLRSTVPQELWTALQVLLLDDDGLAAYQSACEAGTRAAATAVAASSAATTLVLVPLPFEMPSRLLAALAATGGDDEAEEALAAELGEAGDVLTALAAAIRRRLLAADSGGYVSRLGDDVAWLAGSGSAAAAAGTAAIAGKKRPRDEVGSGAAHVDGSGVGLDEPGDYVARCCRLVALREKLLLDVVMRAVVAELRQVQALGGDDGDSSSSDDDDADEDEGKGGSRDGGRRRGGGGGGRRGSRGHPAAKRGRR